MAGTPFGEAAFDVIPPDSILNFTFEEMFTGLIFYKPIQEHLLIKGWPGFTTEDFVPELRRRIAVFSEAKGMGLSEEDIENLLYRNDRLEESRYPGLERMRERIDRWYAE